VRELAELFVGVVRLADAASAGLRNELLVGALDPFAAISNIRETGTAESEGNIGGNLVTHV
jgi:hypothetical protein